MFRQNSFSNAPRTFARYLFAVVYSLLVLAGISAQNYSLPDYLPGSGSGTVIRTGDEAVYGSLDVTLGVLNLFTGSGGIQISAGLPGVVQGRIELDLQGEGAGLHLALTTLPAALYLDFDRNGISLALDTFLATGFHFRSGIPGISHLGLDLFLFTAGVHLGTDSAYYWVYETIGGIDFINGGTFYSKSSAPYKFRIFGAYAGPSYQGFGFAGTPISRGVYNMGEGPEIGTPGLDQLPRDAVDAAFRFHDVGFKGAGGPYPWTWGGLVDQALVHRIRNSSAVWWHDPFAMTKAIMTEVIWGGYIDEDSPFYDPASER
jgi:hypothetical protein